MFNCQILGEEIPESFENVDRTEFKLRNKIGLREMLKSKVVICGLLRDAKDRIPFLKKRIKKLTSYFKDYRVLIVENDSSDGTRKELLKLATEDSKIIILGCGFNASNCSLQFSKTEGHDVTWSRINKMQYLRNIYLEKIYTTYKNFNYMIVWDMDILGSVYLDGIANSFGYFGSKNFDMNAICANGIYRWITVPIYYDTYAHRDKGDSFHISKKTIHDINKGLTVRYSCGEKPVLVNSCFGGFAIYRIKDIIENEAKYGTSDKKSNNIECEHVVFNKIIKKIYMNPSMIHLVLQNE